MERRGNDRALLYDAVSESATHVTIQQRAANSGAVIWRAVPLLSNLLRPSGVAIRAL
jgi:hypothetical protein